MTTKAKRTKAHVPAQPYEIHHGIPVYRSGDAPQELRTETQLKAERLKLAEGQRPHAYLRMYRSGTGWMRVALYAPGEAAKMRPLSAHQQRQKLARRTCAGCGTVKDYPVNSDAWPLYWAAKPAQHCEDCLEALYSEWVHTCDACDTRYQNSTPGSSPCAACRERRDRAWPVIHRLIRRHCDMCSVQTATQEEIDAADAADVYGRSHCFPRRCEPCKKAEARRIEEMRRASERERWDELGPVRDWARHIVAHPTAYAVLDTETTGLDADAKIVEISVTDGAGNTLLDTLVNPGAAIPEEAQEIHGISDGEVRHAPTFGAVLPRLTEALASRKVVIYNADYDMGVLRYELDRHHRENSPATEESEQRPHSAATAWMKSQQWDRCAMLAYAVHVGEWSDYWGGWSWQRLGGGHRALGDCRRVTAIIKEMAEVPDPF